MIQMDVAAVFSDNRRSFRKPNRSPEYIDKIESAISAPRKKCSPAPRVVVIKIKPDQIGLIIERRENGK